MAENYTYAVARIHAKEMTLLTMQDMEQLLACRNVTEALSQLADKGFDVSDTRDIDEVIRRERAAMRRTIGELVGDMSVFDVFLYESDFQNLKAAVKSTVTHDRAERIFSDNGAVSGKLIFDAIKSREYNQLPVYLQRAAETAMSVLLETGDGGLCDAVIDRAYLEEIQNAAKKSDVDMIKRYAELTAALADIRIAVRGSSLGKGSEFFSKSLAECKTLNRDLLINAAAKGVDEVCDYLTGTDYSGAVDEIKASYTAFEKWCDDRIMQELKKEKADNFTLAPIAAYMLGRETELKAVMLVLTGKQNELDDNVIRERLRELYV